MTRLPLELSDTCEKEETKIALGSLRQLSVTSALEYRLQHLQTNLPLAVALTGKDIKNVSLRFTI